ncbi:MAG: asparagine synthase (glutamine-hydrolyzing) [Candidatus Marinimicrobia bacterium]|nr:asparagine synthase (glutamine-hydrolyzing) [Candidatus Neomarinimicrobiota bacterium]
MCGITGISGPNHRSVIPRMTESLIHRGPDTEGFYHGENISLGQRRLSIIDLQGGNQPISNEEDTIQLVCNGEIYNSPDLRKHLISRGHSFKTSTDVEVIIHLYEQEGAACVKKLRGMFAFALWDISSATLLLARDHLGQKPLFYAKNYHHFIFASEVKAILASGLVAPEVNLEGLWHYMSMRFLPDDYTLFKGIEKLPAATTLLYRDNECKLDRYWEVNFTNKHPLKQHEIEEQLDDLLRETIQLHLLSDVPVGTFLSGGIDSSVVTAITAEISGQQFPTFSIGVAEQDFNELPFARIVSDKYHLEAYEEVVEANLIHRLPRMIYHMDEPSDPYGVGVYLVSELASKYVKVALGGDGGDENFAGYDRFAGNRFIDYYNFLPKSLREKFLSRLYQIVPDTFGYKSMAQKLAWVNEMSMYTGGNRYAESMSFHRFARQRKEQLFTREAWQTIQDDDSTEKILKYFDAGNADELVDKMLFTDLMTRMPDHLLTINDRMTMAHSLEGRSPLIDYEIVEFAAAIPADMKLRGKTLKYILKRVASRYLPDNLIKRRKQGFGFPIAQWLRNDLNIFLIHLFDQSRFVALGYFQRAAILELLEAHLSGKEDHNYRLWILLNLELWFRMYFEGMSPDNMGNFIRKLSAE